MGGKGNEVAALALALNLLHWWGVEHVLDQQLYDMLVDLHQHVISPQVHAPPFASLPKVYLPDRYRIVDDNHRFLSEETEKSVEV